MTALREAPQVAAVLAEEELGALRHVGLVAALGAAVEGHDDDLRLPRGLLDALPRRRDVEQGIGPVVGGEAQHGHALAAHLLHGHRPRSARVADADARQRRDGLALGRRAEVVGVVVGQVHHGEPGLLDVARVRGRGAEGEAVRAAGAALRGAAGGEGALQVPEHDVADQEVVDLVEERRTAVGRQAVGQAAHDRVADRRRRVTGSASGTGGAGAAAAASCAPGAEPPLAAGAPDVPESPPLSATAATTATAITATSTARAVRRRRLILRRRSSRRCAPVVVRGCHRLDIRRRSRRPCRGQAAGASAFAACSTASSRPG